uniref:uncharacterized protein LOC122594152 n=1 Tax=Erigeron canadensis TaxID=72917 RepID=UPI001CB9519E|nr:uncharacterized protein LOC122594152 [Erigeron canadensis]
MPTAAVVVIGAVFTIGFIVTLIICRNRIWGLFRGLIQCFYGICKLFYGLIKFFFYISLLFYKLILLFCRFCGFLCGRKSSKKKMDDMKRKKPVRFTSEQLRIATDNFNIKLGSGGFGTVYKGIIGNKTPVAVKVLNGSSEKSSEQQFMAEMIILGRTHHFNLVRLYGFCFESSLRALVYEFMVNGSLDHYLFKANKKTNMRSEKLHEIALGTARGITYLHEECHPRIVHYDIKPGNILLDSNFCAKVADFGLAKLCNSDNSHIMMTARRGTPGYAAPELWMPFPVTHKCDVYSFGMLLFEIIGRRRNMDMGVVESQQYWFPVWAWSKYENKQLKDLMIACGFAKTDEQVVQRMLKVALCCVQYKPENRPVMSIVVKMLEGTSQIPEPLDPFTHLFTGVNEAGDSPFIPLAMAQFLHDMEREKPTQFTSQQLKIATDNFTIKLGSGGFGAVYKGIIGNNTLVAVKVLNGTSDESIIEQQFIAEMSTMGRTYHFNLVRLYGFCFESNLRALVYEFMVNGSLDHYLLKPDKKTVIGFEKLHEIALGTARGLAYLHEECPQRIVHYDIKPGNILLDSNFCAKVADFGLAKLCNRDSSYITMTGGRGTPGYAAPELWMALPVTHKSDVYSFGILLFEIIGRWRKNMDMTPDDIKNWFPVWAWGKYEKKQLRDLMIACQIAKEDEEVAERMIKVALCCVQYKPEARPLMSIVVQMLEGALQVPEPPNPFTHIISGDSEAGDSLTQMALNIENSDWSSSEVASKSTSVEQTPIMKKHEITFASV